MEDQARLSAADRRAIFVYGFAPLRAVATLARSARVANRSRIDIEGPDVTDTCPIVTIELSPQQAAVFHPLLERQAEDRRGLLLMSVAPDLLDGQAIFRLQAVFLA